MNMKRVALLFAVMIGFFSLLHAQEGADGKYTGNLEKKKDWRDKRFGMFIHWGPVTLTGKEIGWSRGSQVPVEEYDSLYKRFNPVKFNADEWVSLAKSAGMKYIVLTSKHHDGFCLWNTRQTDYNIMNTPFGRDVVKELSEACRRQGMAFGLYYSTCDWHHPDFPLTSPGGSVERKESNLDRYTSYLKRQVAELLVNYGPLYVLWFDVPQKFDKTRGQGVIDFARAIQPDIWINDRTGAKGDFNTPEQRIGGFNNKRAWESCMTIARQWSWKPNDKVKSLEQCIQTLVRTVGGDGNLLFNIGPKPDGSVEPEQVERLKEMGLWLERYGETIYGTRGGPYKPADWGVSTRRGNHIYLHILAWQGDKPRIVLPDIGIDVKACRLYDGGKVNCKKNKNGEYEITFSPKHLNGLNTIIELEMDSSVMHAVPVDVQPQSLLYRKKVKASTCPDKKWHGVEFLCNGDWSGIGWRPDKKDKQPWVEFDMEQECKISNAVLFETTGKAVEEFEIQKPSGDGWTTVYNGKNIGERLDVSFPSFKSDKVRILFTKLAGMPELSEIIMY